MFYNLCPICGLPLSAGDIHWPATADAPPDRELEERVAWLDEARLLCDPDDEVGRLLPELTYLNLEGGLLDGCINDFDAEPQSPASPAREIEVFPAKNCESLGTFELIREDGGVEHVDINMSGIETFDGRAYLPIHADCLELARKAFSTSSAMHFDNLRALFICLRWRHGVRGNMWSASFQPTYTLAFKNWYISKSLTSYYEDFAGEGSPSHFKGPTNDGHFNLYYCLTSSPLERLDTGTLLQNLEESPVGSSSQRQRAEAEDFTSRFYALPQEIKDGILSYFRVSRDLDPSARSPLPQSFWMQELALGSEGLLPWLWDIDRDQVHEKALSSCPSGDSSSHEWDWERLVRLLSRTVDRDDWYADVDSYNDGTATPYRDYYTDLTHVPTGLHNRRRIWQLLEESFVGDSLPWIGLDQVRRHEPSMHSKTIPLHWQKDGQRRRDGPIWLPSIAHDYAFRRRLGGKLEFRRGKKPAKCWNGQDEEVETTSAEEIYSILRELGYPDS